MIRPMSDNLELRLEAGNIVTFAADAIMFKHAQAFYGADSAAASRLEGAGISGGELAAQPGTHLWIDTRGALTAPLALFVGTQRLGELGYHEIRQIARRGLTALEDRPHVRHLACTVHGTNIGLDEDEAILALIGGFIEAFQTGCGPRALERITVVEIHPRRVNRMRLALERGLAGSAKVGPCASGWGFMVARSSTFVQAGALATAGAQSTSKPHAFVAMPFLPEMEDVYHYGILGPVRAANLLCERVDQAVFDGLIVQRIRDRIETAKVVIADLSFANPNVYLEVGYAWGRGRPTILLVRDVKELKFDVAATRCLIYSSIRELEKMLTRELEHIL